jgi:hypothetical protein
MALIFLYYLGTETDGTTVSVCKSLCNLLQEALYGKYHKGLLNIKAQKSSVTFLAELQSL